MESFLFEVPGDGDGAGVVSASGELLAKFNDPVPTARGGRRWTVFRASRAWLDRVDALGLGSAEETVEVLTTDSVRLSCVGDGELAGKDVEDRDSVFRHVFDCRVCRDSGVMYLVSLMS